MYSSRFLSKIQSHNCMSWISKMQNNCTKHRELTHTISVFRDWARTFSPHLAMNNSVIFSLFPFFRISSISFRFWSLEDSKVFAYLYVCFLCLYLLKNQLKHFLIINTRNNYFSITNSDNLLVWIYLKIWFLQKLFWWYMGRCSSKYIWHILFLDENKVVYNVLHFLLILLLVSDFWYIMQ